MSTPNQIYGWWSSRVVKDRRKNNWVKTQKVSIFSGENMLTMLTISINHINMKEQTAHPPVPYQPSWNSSHDCRFFRSVSLGLWQETADVSGLDTNHCNNQGHQRDKHRHWAHLNAITSHRTPASEWLQRQYFINLN